MQLCHSGSPLDWPGLVDYDLQYAASHVSQGSQTVAEARRVSLGVFIEVVARLKPVSAHITSQLCPEILSVNRAVHLSLIAVLVVLFSWPDSMLVSRLCHGFPAIGWIPPCGLWASRLAEFQTLQEAFRYGHEDGVELMAGMRESEHDGFACEAGEEDEFHGFCTPEFTLPLLESQHTSYRLIRRFVIQQSSGKLRVIDDACSGFQSKYSSDSNQLRFCSAIPPCLHLQAL